MRTALFFKQLAHLVKIFVFLSTNPIKKIIIISWKILKHIRPKKLDNFEAKTFPKQLSVNVHIENNYKKKNWLIIIYKIKIN